VRLLGRLSLAENLCGSCPIANKGKGPSGLAQVALGVQLGAAERNTTDGGGNPGGAARAARC
jgi:hypothetical protein